MNEIKIRFASPSDAQELLRIYRPYVENTAITFEYTVPTEEEFTQRIRTISSRYPYLVASINNRTAGYAYASPFKGRAAYDWSAETSIYVDASCQGQGVGAALYTELEKYMIKQNIVNACACIALPNPVSIRFHEAFGYKTAAHFHSSGFKDGAWYDMIWMEKFLGEHSSQPEDFVPFPLICRQKPNCDCPAIDPERSRL